MLYEEWQYCFMECKTSGLTSSTVPVLKSELLNWIKEKLFSNNPTQIVFGDLYVQTTHEASLGLSLGDAGSTHPGECRLKYK